MDVRLSSVTIPYLNKETFEQYACLKVYSVKGELVKMNPLVLAAMNSSLVNSLKEDTEECCLVTEFTKEELEAVKEFSWTGKCSRSIANVFSALGMDLFYMFDNKPLVEVKAEEADTFLDDIDEFLLSDAKKRSFDDNFDSDEDYEPQKPKKKKKNLSNSLLSDSQQKLFDAFNYPKLLSDYKRAPLELPIYKQSDKDLEKPLACELCPSRFFTETSLKCHFTKYHSEHYSCDNCYQVFSIMDLELFKLHMFRHEHNLLLGSTSCIQCGTSFRRMSKFTEHLTLQGPFHDNQCSQCCESFTNFEEYKRHVEEKHANLWKFKCGFCKQLFETNSQLSEHCKAIHNKLDTNSQSSLNAAKKKTVCVECGTLITNLKHHMNTVHSTQTHQCPHCELTFKAMPLLQRHIDWIHVKAPCTECGEMVGVRKMPRHIKQKHTSIYDRKFKCETCGKGFSSNAALRDHINVHTGAKPYKCKFCNAAFASVGTHAMHQRSHLGHKRSK